MAGRAGTLWGTLTAPAVPAAAPAFLVLASLPLLRPGVFGETSALAGLGLAVLAGVAALVRRERVAARPVPGIAVMVGLLCLAYLWMVGHAAAVMPYDRVQGQFQDFVLTIGSVVAVAIVLADARTRRAVGRGLVLLLAVLCASWLVTALFWAVAGVGTGQVGAVPVGNVGPQPVYFPFTVSYSTSAVFGVDVPRLTGIGRESGWMAMYCAAGWFLADAVGYRSRVLKALLLAGLVGTLSTAGFGVFVVVLALDLFLRPRGGIRVTGFLRQIGGLAAIAGAGWLALWAPVLGLQAKQTSNETSLAEREDATQAGLDALASSPLGGLGTEKQAGINLISDIAVNGLPFVLLVTAAVLVPALVRPTLGGRAADPVGRAAPVVLTVFLTLLLSQPAAASTWVFVLVAVACGAEALTHAERAEPGSPLTARLHRWCAGRPPPSPADAVPALPVPVPVGGGRS